MTKNSSREKLFDTWAQTYNQDLVNADSFPFIGYERVLAMMIALAGFKDDHVVLDLGIGTGNLAMRIPLPEKQIWGVDFSQVMLDKARIALDGAHLVQADLSGGGWIDDLDQRFDRILSAYTFHEFPDDEKVALIKHLAEKGLTPDGLMVIGDISFLNRKQYSRANAEFNDLWDEEEYYWCAEPVTGMLRKDGFHVKYDQVSVCAGVYQLQLGKGATG